MTDRLTPERLEQIRARADAATPGPWHGEHEGPLGCVVIGDYGWVAPTGAPEYGVDSDQGHADAEFITHAREDVPALLAEVERLRADRDRLKQRLDARPSRADVLREAAEVADEVVPADLADQTDWDQGRLAVARDLRTRAEVEGTAADPVVLHVTSVTDVVWCDTGDVEIQATDTTGRPVLLHLTEGQAAALAEDLADGDVTHAIAGALRDFPWSVYGLDEVQHAPTEWIGDLASAIAGALPIAEDDDPDEHDLGITDRDETAVA